MTQKYSPIISETTEIKEKVLCLNELRYRCQFDKSGRDLSLLRLALEEWQVIAEAVKNDEDCRRAFVQTEGLMTIWLYLHAFSMHPSMHKILLEILDEIDKDCSVFEIHPSDFSSVKMANEEKKTLQKAMKTRQSIKKMLGQVDSKNSSSSLKGFKFENLVDSMRKVFQTSTSG